MTRVKTNHQVAQPVDLADRRERKAQAQRWMDEQDAIDRERAALAARFGPPRPGFDHAGVEIGPRFPLSLDRAHIQADEGLRCEGRSPRLDRGSQPVTSPHHGSDYRALTHAEEMNRGRIGRARADRRRSIHRGDWFFRVLYVLAFVALAWAAATAAVRGLS